jgi:DNA-binding GntR family transcriptional regulator
MTASQRSMARQLGVSKSRVNELLKALETTGHVRLTTSRSGTTVALLAA